MTLKIDGTDHLNTPIDASCKTRNKCLTGTDTTGILRAWRRLFFWVPECETTSVVVPIFGTHAHRDGSRLESCRERLDQETLDGTDLLSDTQ